MNRIAANYCKYLGIIKKERKEIGNIEEVKWLQKTRDHTW